MTSSLSDLVLNWMATYGSPIIAALLYIGALGIPVPGTLIVIASGAFIRQDLLELVPTSAYGYLGTIAGDVSLYALAYFAGTRIERRFGQTAAWGSARDLFKRRGGAAIFLTRWLLTAIAFPTTLVAGTSGYSFRKFLALDVLGELTWVVLYGGLGYAFGSQWELISDFISDFSGFALGALAVGVGAYVLLKTGRKGGKRTAQDG